jgi:hypothetical protein
MGAIAINRLQTKEKIGEGMSMIRTKEDIGFYLGGGYDVRGEISGMVSFAEEEA